MKHQVFVLHIEANPADGKPPKVGKQIETIGNLEDLNKLLDEGWLIDSVITTEPKTSIKSFIYNLKKGDTTKASPR